MQDAQSAYSEPRAVYNSARSCRILRLGCGAGHLLGATTTHCKHNKAQGYKQDAHCHKWPGTRTFGERRADARGPFRADVAWSVAVDVANHKQRHSCASDQAFHPNASSTTPADRRRTRQGDDSQPSR